MPAPPVSNTAEGGTDGTTITTGNTGGASGDAFDVVAVGSGGAATFAAAAAKRGSLGYRFVNPATSVASYAQWSSLGIASGSTIYGRVYLRLSALPGVLFTRYYDSGGTQANEMVIDATGHLTVDGASGAALAGLASTTVLAVNTWYRIEWRVLVSATAGEFEWRLFAGADLDGTTPTESKLLTGLTTIGASIGNVRLGQASSFSGGGFTLDMDDLALATAGWIGPAAVAAAPVNTVAPAATGTAQVGQTVSTDQGTWTGSPTGYTYQWQRRPT